MNENNVIIDSYPKKENSNKCRYKPTQHVTPSFFFVNREYEMDTTKPTIY